jgi:hypothetical protein
MPESTTEIGDNMNSNLIMGLFGFGNVALIGMLVYFLIRDRRAIRISKDVILIDLLSRFGSAGFHERGDARTPEKNNILSKLSPGEVDYSARVKTALGRLESGEDADGVAQELGFSRAEMEALREAASDSRAGETFRSETSGMVQK